MLNTIRMPQMGVSDESAILAKWLVREGERIRRGQPIFSLETDKATFQYEAKSDGYLVRILTGEGEEAAVGSPVGIVSGAEGDFTEAELTALLDGLKPREEGRQVRIMPGTCGPDKEDDESKKEHPSPQKMPNFARGISPRARKTANERGMDLTAMHHGSGPGGRIIERDVLSAAQGRSACGSKPKTSNISPGRPLTQSDRIQVRTCCTEKAGETGFVSRLVDARKILSDCNNRNGIAPGVLICHGLAGLLAGIPRLNARRHDSRIYGYGTVHLRLTVKTPSCTLKPVIRCAETCTPDELAVLMRNAAGRCMQFTSKPHEFQDGTFTVADLSEYGIDFFSPELTRPELCALGIGAISTQTRIDARGGNEAYPAIRLTLAYDSSAVEAAEAADFLNRLAFRLEPDAMKQ